MLSVEETGALISSAQSGDEAAKERLIKENLPLVSTPNEMHSGFELYAFPLKALQATSYLGRLLQYDNTVTRFRKKNARRKSTQSASYYDHIFPVHPFAIYC